MSIKGSAFAFEKDQIVVQEVHKKQRPRSRISILLLFLGVASALYALLARVAPPLDAPIGPFMLVWGACFLLYFAACVWILSTRPADRRQCWIELALLFAGALIFRLLLLPLPPGLSRDAWRYLWDGRVILHGYNPYVYAPLDKALKPLRDIVFANCPYAEIPTEYPPGAQLFFLLGYLLMATNLLATKALFVCCDLGTCVVTTLLLARRQMDPRRCIIYAWSPLPIVEFALAGHVDAVAILFTTLAVYCSLGSWRGARVWAGILLGMATLAKIYPIILLFAFVRRRDWPLLAACALTILPGYLPFMLFSGGHWLAAPLSFAGQSNMHPGVLPTIIFILEHHLQRYPVPPTVIIDAVDVLIVVPVLLIVVLQRLRNRLSVEMAVLILVGSFLAASAHIFPWYAAAFLPWLALLLGPIWDTRGFHARGLALVMVWYFTCTVTLSYFPGLKQYFTDTNWLLYFGASFGVVLVGWAVALCLGVAARAQAAKGAGNSPR